MNVIDHWKAVTDEINTPTLTGEDIYLRDQFFKLIDAHAVDIVQPDLAMILHFAGTPV